MALPINRTPKREAEPGPDDAIYSHPFRKHTCARVLFDGIIFTGERTRMHADNNNNNNNNIINSSVYKLVPPRSTAGSFFRADKYPARTIM